MQSFGHFMASFLWSMRVQTVEKCDRSVLYDNREKLTDELDGKSVRNRAHVTARMFAFLIFHLKL